MIKHIVLFKFKPNISDQDIAVLAEKFSLLQKKIPGIVDYTWSENISPEHLGRGYTHGFMMTFKNSAYRDAYIDYPEHKAVVSYYLNPILEEGLVFDLQSGKS